MYKAYVKEKENLDTFETEAGFGAYSISPFSRTMDIGDFFIKPEFRTGRHSTSIFEDMKKIALDKGCKKITCCVVTSQLKPEASMYVILRHKFKFSHINGDVIYFYLDI